MGNRIWICDDDEVARERYRVVLEAEGYRALDTFGNGREVLDELIRGGERPAVLLLDLNMPKVSGQEVLAHVSEHDPEIQVIIITSVEDVRVAVECIKRGAVDFMPKPVDNSRLAQVVRNALRVKALEEELRSLSTADDELDHPEAFANIITANADMRRLFRYVEVVSTSPKAVLITGESGAGKELMARAVHIASGRPGKFVAVNVAGLDEQLFSDTLFGHVKGAYTGADRDRKGLIEAAADGTIFLDEIGDLDMQSQVKLLRLLQENEYFPLGTDIPERSSARVVAATNVDLLAGQRDGTFRRDLYYRLIAHHVDIPPLRKRPEDLRPLVEHFVREATAQLQAKALSVPDELFDLLRVYALPGNVRELQSMMFDAVSRSGGTILSVRAVREYVERQRLEGHSVPSPEQRINYSGPFPTLKEVEDFFIQEAMRAANNNQTVAASLLGVSQSTLSRRTSK